MSVDSELQRPGTSLTVALSNAIVGLLREYTGRGPTRAHTTIRDNVVLVMLEQTLTKGEQVLVDKGRIENVLALRREYQEAMREEGNARVAELTGRRVLAMMSANHVNPDLGAEIYVLDGPPAEQAAPGRDRPPTPPSCVCGSRRPYARARAHDQPGPWWMADARSAASWPVSHVPTRQSSRTSRTARPARSSGPPQARSRAAGQPFPPHTSRGHES